MPECYFENFREANVFAKKVARAGQNPTLKTMNSGFVVVFDEFANDVPGVSNYENRRDKSAVPIGRDKSKYSDSQIERLTLSDLISLSKRNFSGCDLNVLTKMYNRLLMLDATEDVLNLYKNAINQFRPVDRWMVENDFGGARDEIKRMCGQDFSEIRRRGRL